MELKSITEDDFPFLRDMINIARWQEKVFLAPDQKLSTSDVSSFIKEKTGKNYWNYIIWEIGKRAGYVDFEILNHQQGHIAGIYLKPQFRGKGYAGQALEFAIKELKKTNCQSIRADIFPHNQSAKLLFQHRGFVESQQFKHPVAEKLALRLILQLN